MERLKFSVSINAGVIKVYDSMLSKKTFVQWTAAFNPSSTFEGDWEKNSKMYFIGVNKEGKKEGMIGIVEENLPLEFVSIYYIGILDGDKEITEGPIIEEWANAYENYYFKEIDGKTTVTVEMDINDKMRDYFNLTYPKALAKLKEICEN